MRGLRTQVMTWAVLENQARDAEARAACCPWRQVFARPAVRAEARRRRTKADRRWGQMPADPLDLLAHALLVDAWEQEAGRTSTSNPFDPSLEQTPHEHLRGILAPAIRWMSNTTSDHSRLVGGRVSDHPCDLLLHGVALAHAVTFGLSCGGLDAGPPFYPRTSRPPVHVRSEPQVSGGEYDLHAVDDDLCGAAVVDDELASVGVVGRAWWRLSRSRPARCGTGGHGFRSTSRLGRFARPDGRGAARERDLPCRGSGNGRSEPRRGALPARGGNQRPRRPPRRLLPRESEP